MKSKIFASILLSAVAIALGAVGIARHRFGPAPNVKPRTFEVQGVVRGVDLFNKTLRIAHQEIPNYMPAMTMPFPFKDAAPLKELVEGDSVQFELVVTENDSWISHVEKIQADHPGSVSTSAPDAAVAECLHPGETVPDFTLLNQDGQSFHLKDFHGKAVLLTFIYTRCPLPNFCPLMTKNFSELEQRLRKEFAGRFQLLSLSIDPGFDSPEVLKAYGARYEADPKDWTFATGDSASIRAIADVMGLSYEKENGLISHDLRTALIGPDGRLVHLWKSNVWTPYEVQRRVRETLTGSPDIAVR